MHSLGFTNYSNGAESQHEFGWFYLGLIGIVALINITFMVAEIIGAIKEYCRKKKLRKKVEQIKSKAIENQTSPTREKMQKKQITAQLEAIEEEEDEEEEDSERSSSKS